MPGVEGEGQGCVLQVVLGTSATKDTTDAEATTKKILQAQLTTSPLLEPLTCSSPLQVKLSIPPCSSAQPSPARAHMCAGLMVLGGDQERL